MKILYDHQIFTAQKYGGISRYFFELIKRFDGIDDSCDVAIDFTNNAYYNKDFNPKLSKGFPNFHFRGKGRITKFFNERKSLQAISSGNFDVFHPTYYDNYFLDRLKDKPLVVTFHDMIHEKFANQFKFKDGTVIFNRKKNFLEKSSKIIAVSETTKKDILEYFDIDPSKIEVVYLGNSLENFDVGNQRLVNEDYILFVGNRGEYKNFTFFVSSMAQFLIDNNLKLICAGGGDFSPQEIILIQSLKLENRVVFKKTINDNMLANYYTHALFFCFPSLYEGFGIPVLEAFACGCPALLSNGGSLPEVGGDAAVYFDPTSMDSLKTEVHKLLNDEQLRKTLKEKGRERLPKFSWDKTFQQHLEVYKSVI